MPSCRVVQKNLTAWIDGELPRRRGERMQRHVATCAQCAGEAEGLRAAIGAQRRAFATVTAVSDIAPGAQWLQLQSAMRRAEPERVPIWGWVRSWVLHPLPLTGAAVAAAVLLLFLMAGGPAAVLIPLGVESPPVAVKANPELFRNYPLIQHLDVLENFDTVESVPLDDDQTPHEG